ncbi:MAG: hypothetical protein P8J55_01060 [Pseudomonadales bacterium]|nr:hypothetical protein [Pseudomonadales bacterium]
MVAPGGHELLLCFKCARRIDMLACLHCIQTKNLSRQEETNNLLVTVSINTESFDCPGTNCIKSGEFLPFFKYVLTTLQRFAAPDVGIQFVHFTIRERVRNAQLVKSALLAGNGEI